MPVRDLFRFALLISYQQAYTRARRSIAAFVGIAGGIVLVLMQLGFQSALYDSSVRLHNVLDGEVIVIPAEFHTIQDPTWFPREWLVMTMAHPEVKSTAPVYLSAVTVRSLDDRSARTLLAIGIDVDEPAIIIDRIKASIAPLRVPGRILFDARSQPNFGDVLGRLRRDGTAEIETASFSTPLQTNLVVAGSHVLGGTIVYAGTALMSAATLSSINAQPLQRINIGVVKLRPGADSDRVARELKPVLPPGATAMSAADFVRLEKRFWSKETPIGFLFDIGAAIGFLISAIYTYQVLFQIVDENLSEYAVLQTMGYPRWFFTVVVMSTALILAVAALPPAVLLSAGLYEICIAATLLDLKLTLGRILAVGAIAAAVAIASAWLAKRRLNQVDPAILM